jgi:hypothetical protein
MNASEIQIKGRLIAGALLSDTAVTLQAIDRAGGIPQGVTFAGDAGAVIAAARQIPRDVAGDEAALMLMDAIQSAGIKGKLFDALADRGSPLEVPGLIADLHAHAADKAALDVISTPGDAAFKIHELTRIYSPLGGGTIPKPAAVETWITDPPPPHNPVLVSLFDWFSLAELVGPSKTRKTYILMQIALGLVTGRGAFGFDAGGQFRVLIADMELTEADLRRRLYTMTKASGVTPADIEGRLSVLTLAGLDDPRKAIEAASGTYDVLIVDPLYVLCDGGETIDDLRPVLRWLRKLASKCAAVIYCHHDGKGFAGERSTRDRGSGSGITGRAVNARITVTPSASDPENTVVLGFMCRSYATPPPSVWTFDRGLFVASDLPADTETANGSRARGAVQKLSTYEAAAGKALQEQGPLSPATFKQHLRETLGLSKNDADVLTSKLVESGAAVRWRSGGFHPTYMIGTKSQAERASPAYREAGREAQ